MNELTKFKTDVSTSNNARAIQEVQGQIIVAQNFPRNINEATTNILEACKRVSLAKGAMYSYPKGGTNVTGASIRLVEVIALYWKNLKYGVEEIEKGAGETRYRVYAWDLETNVQSEMFFSQKHARWTKKGGLKDLSGGDPRDTYEIVMSNAARRLRACIMKVIPPYILEEAIEECFKTLQGQGQGKPIVDRCRKMVVAFKESFGVTESMIIKRLGHNLDAINEVELVNLQTVYTSLRDNMSKVTDFFDYDDVKKEKLNNDYSDKVEEVNKGSEGVPQMSFPLAITTLVNCKSKSQLKRLKAEVFDRHWNEKEKEDLERTYIKKEEYLNNA